MKIVLCNHCSFLKKLGKNMGICGALDEVNVPIWAVKALGSKRAIVTYGKRAVKCEAFSSKS